MPESCLSCFLNTEGASALEAAVLVAKEKIPMVSQNFSSSCCLFLSISMSSTWTTECPEWDFSFHQKWGLEMGISVPVLCCPWALYTRFGWTSALLQTVLSEDKFFYFSLPFNTEASGCTENLAMPDNVPLLNICVVLSYWPGGVSSFF